MLTKEIESNTVVQSSSIALVGEQLQQLFNVLPGVYFVVKNREGRVIMANQFATEMCGLESASDMIGKDDYDLFPEEQAEQYVRDDQKVFESGQPIIDRIELAPDPGSAINWFITTKLPLRDENGAITGLACIARNMDIDSEKVRPYTEMNEVLEFIRINYASSIRVEEMAPLVNLSIGQFERKFKRVFGIPPKQHLLNVRIQAACHLLGVNNDTIASIANETGFYDHSHFCRCFKNAIGVTPGDYRQQRARKSI